MDILPQTIRAIVARVPAVLPHLTREAKILYSIKADIADINARYHDAIVSALINYFEGRPIAEYRRKFKQAMLQAFGDAFDAGWIDGGGTLPIDDDAMEWIEARLNQEAANIDALFQQAKQLRRDKDFDYFPWIVARADGYTASAAGVYNAAKMLADERQMLTWHYGDADHCATCQKLNGQRHRASWYISRNFIPGKPGAAMQCGGYRCKCYLTNKDGNVVTI